METKRTLDYRTDLERAMRLAARPERIEALLSDALDALASVIPYDLATVMEFSGVDELKPRMYRGPLARPEIAELRLNLENAPAVKELLHQRKARAFTEADHRESGDIYDDLLALPHGHSCMVVPLYADEEDLGILTLDRVQCETYSDEIVRLGTVYGHLIGLALNYAEQSSVLLRLRAQLQEQNALLLSADPGRSRATDLVEACASPGMREVVRLARQVALSDAPVLITGETGTGKEVLASAIHGWSRRHDRPMTTVNCAALPPSLIETELFGHTKGAFSGAVRDRLGRFQVANGGTLMLDEIGELPLEMQAKLLRVLQEGAFQPVGSDDEVRVDVRIIAATHVNLQEAVSEGRFREDLYYRLCVFPLVVPPLRQRVDDLPVLVEACLDKLQQQTGRGPWTVSGPDLTRLRAHAWPGNVRELYNVLERATIVSGQAGPLHIGALQPGAAEVPTPAAAPGEEPFPSLADMERVHFEAALRRAGGKLYGKGGAAELLGLNPSTAKSRMLKLGLGGARSFKKSLEG
ncbi:MAG: sigma 54-interacting transcriptional regulator [Deltaproteobacteria bacterium]|nr:sigma 54-interacting transcriptional regulator [Deltaproteobacteria bacterium]